MTFVSSNNVNLITFHFTIEDDIRTLFTYALPELPGHFLDITDVQIKLLGNLTV